MPLPSFDDLAREADESRPDLPLVVAGAADPTVLAALREATDRGWVRPTLVGVAEEVREVARRESLSLDGLRIVEADDAAGAAVAEVREGRSALLMKGRVATPALMRAILDADRGLRWRHGHAIGQAVLMEVPRDGRRFLLGDTGVMIRPDLPRKRAFLERMVEFAHALGEPSPKVAVMAASESPTEAMPETLGAAALQAENEKGAIPGCAVQGPLSFDLAYAADAADKKRVAGPVVGEADILLFPDLASANLTVKAIMYTADCRFGGVLLGAACPVVFMSRADSVATRLRSISLAMRLVGATPPTACRRPDTEAR